MGLKETLGFRTQVSPEQRVDTRQFVRDFLTHPSPAVVCGQPGIPDENVAVIPGAGGEWVFAKDARGVPLPRFLEAAAKDFRDLRSLDTFNPDSSSFYDAANRTALADALQKSFTFVFDGQKHDFEQFIGMPDEWAENMQNWHFRVVEVPVFHGLLGHDVYPSLSYKVPASTTRARLGNLGLVYSSK